MFVSILLAILALLLVSAGIEDVRTRTIANWKNAAVALLAPAWWWANGMALWPDVAMQLVLALVVLALFALAFALRQMGGGDVKLIAALALWLPLQPLVWMLIVMALLGGALTLAMLIEQRLRGRGAPLEIPYGVAIVLAALLSIGEPIINHLR